MQFVTEGVVHAMHDAQIAAYGGLSGIRDSGLLSSALARPQNKHAYGESDLFALAASYAFGIARNHPFLDANKRTALQTALMFLALNGAAIPPPSVAMVEQMILLAEGTLSEDGFATWLRSQPTQRA